MANNFVTSDFTAVPGEELVTKDIYTVTEDTVVSKPTLGTEDPGLLNSLMDVLKDSNGDIGVETITDLLDDKLNANQLNESIQTITGFSPSTTKLLMELLAGNDSNPLEAMASGKYPDAELRYGDNSFPVSKMDFKTAKGITAIIQSLTGNTVDVSIISKSNESELFTALLKVAVIVGIPLLIDAIIDKVKDDKVKRRILIDSLDTAVYNSDIPTIYKIIGATSKASVLDRMPDIVVRVLSNYRFAPGTKTEQYPALRTDLLSFATDMDPNWDTILRNGVPVMNLEPFTYASKDAFILLGLDSASATPSVFKIQIGLAKLYRPVDLWTTARRMYGTLLVL